MTILHQCVSFGLIFALAGNAGGQSSHGDGHDMHSGPVMNYHRVDERLLTGGHLVGDGLKTLQAEGVSVVVDLRDEAPLSEKQKYAEYGIEWINVPVAWKKPRPEDFTRFSEVMSEQDGEHVFVQCAANYRASAFTYICRVVVGGVDDQTALANLHAIWNPKQDNRKWNQYIEDILATTDSGTR